MRSCYSLIRFFSSLMCAEDLPLVCHCECEYNFRM